jgi:hypothetical protein
VPGAASRWCSTVTSIVSFVPGSKYGRFRCTSAMYFLSTGDHVLVDA